MESTTVNHSKQSADEESLLESLLLTWQEAFERGSDLPAAELCRDRPELQPKLQQRIDDLRRVDALMRTPNASGEAVARTLPLSQQPIPEVPGYEILGKIGCGGMGVVYKARQTALQRLVALKMILAGSHAGQDERVRFLREAEAVASVRHPGIVQVYDFGTLDGLPYFSMELYEGGSLADRLRESPLPPREAAVMVEQIARAVQAAHEVGVIHRDLKPGNVLLGADGKPRVTDFGLAKRIDVAGNTHTGDVLGSPPYVAPEQARGQRDVGPLADVYALGTVLYECLSGRPPFRAATPMETILSVLADEPVPLRHLQSKLPKDLETICHKCLQKEPGKRYASAADLADDLRRFLDNRPIAARPVGRAERLVRLCRRHPAVTTVSTAAALFLLAGLFGMTVLYFRAEDQRRGADQARKLAEAESERANKERESAEEQRKSAQQQAERARQVSVVLTGMFDASDPLAMNGLAFGLSHRAGQTLAARELLERALQMTESDATLGPVVKAAIYNSIGNVYRSIGLHKKAEPLLERALELRKKHSVSPADVAESLYALAWLHHERGNYPTSERLYREALAEHQKNTPVNEEALLNVEFNLTWLLLEMGEDEEALARAYVVLERRVKHYGEDHRQTAFTRFGMASLLLKVGRPLEAIPLIERAMATLQKLGIDQNILNAGAQCMQGIIKDLAFNDLAGAAKELQQSLELTRQTLGAKHVYVTLPLGHLAMVEVKRGRDDEALKSFLEVLEIVRDGVGMAHPHVMFVVEPTAAIYRRKGKADEATPLFEEVIRARREQFGDEHPYVADALLAQSNHEFHCRRSDRELALLEQARKAYAATAGRPPRQYPTCLRWLGWNHSRRRQYAQAEKHYRLAVEIRRQREKETEHETVDLMLDLAVALIRQKKGEEAETTLKQAGDALAKSPEQSRRALHPRWVTLSAELLCLRGDHATAAALLDRHGKEVMTAYQQEESARGFVRCLEALERDSKMGDEAAKLKGRYADAAVERLRQAWRAKSPRAASWAASADWALLREHPPFRALTEEIRQAKK